MPDPTPAESAKSSAPAGQKSFEDALAELEEIVAQLEAGAKPLDESLALYEKGVGALKHCHGILDKAEKRIRLLVKNARGEAVIEDAVIPNLGAGKKAVGRSSSDEDASPVIESAQDSKNSAQQTVDYASLPRQNPSPSVKTKSRTTQGKSGAAGGSLFGSSQ